MVACHRVINSPLASVSAPQSTRSFHAAGAMGSKPLWEIMQPSRLSPIDTEIYYGSCVSRSRSISINHGSPADCCPCTRIIPWISMRGRGSRHHPTNNYDWMPRIWGPTYQPLLLLLCVRRDVRLYRYRCR